MAEAYIAVDWNVVSAFAEIIGAIAVVISIIYLARQVTNANDTAEAATTLDVSKVLADWHRGVNQTPDLADIWVRGMVDGESLNEIEVARFQFLNAELFILIEGLYRQYQLGFVKPEAWKPIERTIVRLFSSPLFTDWWDSGVSSSGEDFRTYVDQLRAEDPQEAWGGKIGELLNTKD